MDAKNDPNLRKKGQVKGVPTGDTVIFQGPPNKQGIPLEKTLRLHGIIAPVMADIDRPDRKEEPYAYEAREYLRKKLIGKQVFFYTEHKIGDREYGRIIVDDEDIAEALLTEGLAELNDDVTPTPANVSKYRKAYGNAESSGKGIHSEDQKVLNAKTRKVLPVENGAAIVEKNKNKTVNGIVEEFRNGVFNIYVPDLNAIIKLSLHAIVIPNMGYNAGQDVRCFIDTNFLQREVEISLTGFDERSGYFQGNLKSKENPSYNLIKELLKLGYGRLNSDAYKLLDPADHRSSKQAQDEAQRNKLRVWVNFESDRKTSASTIDKEEEYQARVVEAHSGDSVTVENLKNGELTRVYLANVRAPAIGNPKKGESPKPWAWEAKEFVRSQAVGKKVRIEVEFSKKIPVRQDEEGVAAEEKDFIFVSIILPNDKNVSELLVSHGFANVNPPRGDDSFTKYMKQLSEAEEEAKNKKVGLYSSKTPANPAKFSDYGQQGMASKAKQFFEFAKNEANLTGVVEAVLSGSLFKVRLDKQNCYILFSLAAIRTYAMEKNVPQYEKFAKEALKFSKEQVLQRDVEISLNSVTPKGVLQGVLTVNRKNFAHSLLEQGLAYVETYKADQKYGVPYRAVERTAEEKKIGIWGAGIPVRSSNTRGGFSVKAITESKVGTVIEVLAPEEFYIHAKDSKRALETIENELTKIKSSEAKLEQPVKKGIPCVAKFSEDGKWYRARIEKLISPTKFGVVFTDYGNYDEVSYDDIRKISPQLLSTPALAIKCGLAFAQSADKRSATHEDSAERLRELIWEKEVNVQFVYEDSTTKYGIVYLSGKTGNIKDSVNTKLIGEGLVRLSEDSVLPNDQLAVLREEDEKARIKKTGGWKNNDFFEEEEDY